MRKKPSPETYSLDETVGRPRRLPPDCSFDVRRRIPPSVLNDLEPDALVRMHVRRAHALAVMVRHDVQAALYREVQS